jgi:ATP dependent DNA ligase C terminal region
LGGFQNGRLRYFGHSGTGFSGKGLKEAIDRLKPLFIDESPVENPPNIPEKIQSVQPRLVCEVAYAEWTQDEQLRQTTREIRRKISTRFSDSAAELTPLQEFLKWNVSDPRTRTISPFFDVTVGQWIENRISEGTLDGLRAAIQVDPANARLAGHFGRAFATNDSPTSNRRRPQRHAWSQSSTRCWPARAPPSRNAPICRSCSNASARTASATT